MLGCQDFCGYYDWTFHYLRRRFGQEAVRLYWRDAIAMDSQNHYTAAGRERGLAGLYDTWVQTGIDEKCDWTFTLDEAKNVLRLDMRECPSKGFLLKNDRNADEDYCDHCIGWIGPALEGIGAEVASHEHNHCGQCWWEMRMKGRPHESPSVDVDIRKDARWQRGFLDRWREGVALPVLDQHASTDPCDVLLDWYAGADRLTVLGRGPSALDQWTKDRVGDAVIVTDPTYATRDVYAGEPLGVLIGDRSIQLEAVSKRFNQTDPERRPLLMHMFLPGCPMIDFVSLGLPRPVPILPLLIRQGLYTHRPGQPYPTTGVFALLLAVALGKKTAAAGIDLYKHPSGQVYTAGGRAPAAEPFAWPSWHSEACELASLRAAIKSSGGAVDLHPHLRSLL